MTDLEITRLCAEASGIPYDISNDRRGAEFVEIIDQRNPGNGGEYDPLHDDAQAMALVKKFPIECWPAVHDYAHTHLMGTPNDLNRAICECVAKMKTKETL